VGEHHVAKHLGLPHLIEIVETTHLEVEQAVLWPSSSPLSRGIASLRVFDIIDIDKDRLNLSIKQLTDDPWISEVEKFKKGDEVEGTVTRITPFGAFVQLSPSVEALVHVSELGKGDDVNPENIFTLNEKKQFRILDIDKDNRKISLCLAK